MFSLRLSFREDILIPLQSVLCYQGIGSDQRVLRLKSDLHPDTLQRYPTVPRC